MSARGFLGAGDLYIRRYDPITQTFLPEEGPFEATKFEIKPNSDLKEQTSRGKTTYGQVIESVPLPKPSDLSVDLGEVNRESLSMALFGTATEINRGAGTITAEVVIAKAGKWVQLSKSNFAEAGFLVKDTTATTTYVYGTDYIVNWRLGTIKVLAGGAIDDLDSLKVSGSYNATTGTSIAGATQSQVRAKFRLDGINFADQAPCITTVHEAVLTPDNGFDFLGDDFATISLKGRMKTPAGFSEPFVTELHDA